MNNLKYYNDSLAHDYDMFMPARKKGTVIDYPKTRKKSNTKVAAKSSKAVPILIAITILGMTCGNIFLRAEITRVSSQINKEDTIVSELQSEITRLEVDVERRVSLNNLESAAEKLGMHKREKNQVIYLKVNNENAAETAEGQMLTEADNK